MIDRRVWELIVISVLSAFCGGLALALDHEFFATAFAAAAAAATVGAVAVLVGRS